MSENSADNRLLNDYSHAAYFPWQQTLWQQLYGRTAKHDHFPHALLLNGITGIGKTALAFHLARGLLCQTVQKNPVSHQFEPCLLHDSDKLCRCCQLFSAASHPDVYPIHPLMDKKIISVEQIRELIQWSVLNSQLSGKKIIIIEPAEAMNVNASNALLKTLEEPVDNTVIILLSHKKQSLLATIRSRCRIIDVPLPEQQSALRWLEQQESVSQNTIASQLLLSLSSGAPLTALQLLNSQHFDARKWIINLLLSIVNDSADPVAVAETMFKQSKIKPTKAKRSKANASQAAISAYDFIYWFDAVLTDIVRLVYGCRRELITNIDYFDNLQQLSNRLYLKKILQLSDSINKAYYEIQGQVNINLLFEKLLIDWNYCQK